MAKYVLTEFKINENEDTFLSISCRPSGILNWILTRLGLVATATLKGNQECLDYSAVSLKGFESVTAPHPCVTAVVYGMHKPFWLLVATIICSLLGTLGAFTLGAAALIFLVLACVFGWLYYIRKNFYIGFMNGGDTEYSVKFYASIIEG